MFELKSRRIRALDVYVVFSLTVLLIYTILSLIIFKDSMQEASTLTTCVYSTFGGEILACALIKIFKLRSVKGGENNG